MQKLTGLGLVDSIGSLVLQKLQGPCVHSIGSHALPGCRLLGKPVLAHDHCAYEGCGKEATPVPYSLPRTEPLLQSQEYIYLSVHVCGAVWAHM